MAKVNHLLKKKKKKKKKKKPKQKQKKKKTPFLKKKLKKKKFNQLKKKKKKKKKKCSPISGHISYYFISNFQFIFEPFYYRPISQCQQNKHPQVQK
nr:hypothetical protein [uncultured Agathobaculum sp.]